MEKRMSILGLNKNMNLIKQDKRGMNGVWMGRRVRCVRSGSNSMSQDVARLSQVL